MKSFWLAWKPFFILVLNKGGPVKKSPCAYSSVSGGQAKCEEKYNKIKIQKKAGNEQVIRAQMWKYIFSSVHPSRLSHRGNVSRLALWISNLDRRCLFLKSKCCESVQDFTFLYLSDCEMVCIG